MIAPSSYADVCGSDIVTCVCLSNSQIPLDEYDGTFTSANIFETIQLSDNFPVEEGDWYANGIEVRAVANLCFPLTTRLRLAPSAILSLGVV